MVLTGMPQEAALILMMKAFAACPPPPSGAARQLLPEGEGHKNGVAARLSL